VVHGPPRHELVQRHAGAVRLLGRADAVLRAPHLLERAAAGSSALTHETVTVHCHGLAGSIDILPAAQRLMAERADVPIEEVAASHASMVSQPAAATRRILMVIEETAAAG
jgi:hypothetical protein